MNWLAKIKLRGPGPWINIAVNYCCMRVLLYAKFLKETETEETIVFSVTFLSLVAFQLGGGLSGPTLATPMARTSDYRLGTLAQTCITVMHKDVYRIILPLP